ncbi:MAG TPA: hypothetical protein VHE37_14920 [Nevskiaceae bacterium]|nr:hypothetical protein [Nevskiaceae bacterium]
MNTRRWLLALACMLCTDAGAADFSLGADYWGYQVRGSVNRNGDVLDFDRDLGVQAQTHALLQAAWNTGPGWWKPDFALSYAPIKAGGQQEVTAGTRFGGLLFPSGNTVIFGDADLKDLALTLRYPLALGNARIWGGISAKHVNGEVTVRDRNDTQEDVQDINQWFPMLHVAAAIPAASWLTLSAEANGARYASNQAWDVRAGASIGIYGPLGLNAGWAARHYHVESDSSYRLDATLSGVTAGLYLLLR